MTEERIVDSNCAGDAATDGAEQSEAKGSHCGRHPLLHLLLAVAAGILVGSLFAHFSLGASRWVEVLALPGRLWLKALKCIVLPMIVLSLIKSVFTMRALPCARSVGLCTIGLYLATTVVAALEACLVSTLIFPSALRPMPHEETAGEAAGEAAVQRRGVLETAMGLADNLVPGNLVEDAAKNNLLPVIVASIIFGVLVADRRPDGGRSRTMELVDEWSDVVTRVVTALMSVTPIGVGSLVLQGAASIDLGVMGAEVGVLIGAVACGLAIHAFVAYPMLLLLCRRNPLVYFRNILPALATALGTSSSAAALPVTLSCATERNGIPAHIAEFSLSLGATINMDGTTIYLVCATSFLAELHGVHFGLQQWMLVVALATLCSTGSAPVPSASLVLLATMLAAVGVPLDKTFGLITAVDWMLDRLRTSVNVAGDSSVAAYVALIAAKKGDEPCPAASGV